MRLPESSFPIKLTLFFALLAAFAAASLAQQPKSATSVGSRIDSGLISDNVYTNKTLGFKLKFPAEMVPDSRKELDEGLKEGAALLKEGTDKHDKTINKMAEAEKIVFGLTTSENGAFGVITVSVMQGLGSGPLRTMVQNTTQLYIDSMKSKVTQPVTEELLGGISVLSFGLVTNMNKVDVKSKIYVLRRNDHRISISVTYVDEDGLRLMDGVLRRIEFF